MKGYTILLGLLLETNIYFNLAKGHQNPVANFLFSADSMLSQLVKGGYCVAVWHGSLDMDLFDADTTCKELAGEDQRGLHQRRSELSVFVEAAVGLEDALSWLLFSF